MRGRLRQLYTYSPHIFSASFNLYNFHAYTLTLKHDLCHAAPAAIISSALKITKVHFGHRLFLETFVLNERPDKRCCSESWGGEEEEKECVCERD